MVRNLSKKFSFITFGGFDPKKSGAEIADFKDIGHTSKVFIDRIFDPQKLKRLN
jgi:hypothetical protein